MGNTELYEDIYKKELGFNFGKNWKNYLDAADKEKLEKTKEYFVEFMGGNKIKGKTFVDIGSGSGLLSLAAFQLGAKKVVSLDIDDNSIVCTKRLRAKHANNSSKWQVKKGSILDADFVKSLGKFDVVYSWGVLHHTGAMWRAIDNSLMLCKKDSLYYISIYNDRRGIESSKYWLKVKKFVSRSNKPTRDFMLFMYTVRFHLVGLARGQNRFKWLREFKGKRGMIWKYDAIDWLGGYPYEFAKVQKIIRHVNKQGFVLHNVTDLRNALGCNEFLFQKL